MKNLIFRELLKHYKEKMVYAILSGNRKPSLEVIISLQKSINIPAEVWLDIKSYIRENNTKQKSK